MAKGTPLMESGYDGVFKNLIKEMQTELIERKAYYVKAAGISL